MSKCKNRDWNYNGTCTCQGLKPCSVRPTRFYSNKQEKHIAKAVKGKQVANSGATAFSKGDVRTDDWLFEAKTKTSESQSMSIKKEWLLKNREEMFAMGKSYNALVFDYGDGNNYYVLDEKTFLQMKEALENELQANN